LIGEANEDEKELLEADDDDDEEGEHA